MSKSTSETGHLINWTNFSELQSVCISLGKDYKPSRDIHQLGYLETKYQLGKKASLDLSESEQICKAAIGERLLIFDAISTKVSRIVSGLISAGAPAHVIKQAEAISRKMTGRRAKKLDEPEPAAPGQPSPTDKSISVSQQSFIRKADNFKLLIMLLRKEPTWKPNEEDMTVETLSKQAASMTPANELVDRLYDDVKTGRIYRDLVFYDKTDGLVITARSVKNYIRSAFGPSSPQFKMVSDLEFRVIKSGK